MAGFELQGQYAVSCEPFSDWCNEQGINLGTHAVTETLQQDNTWNLMLEATKSGDLANAKDLLDQLNEATPQILDNDPQT